MTAGGQTPEELEALLEDALLMRDAEALAQLFEDASVLVAGPGPRQIHGPGEIAAAAGKLWQHQPGYLAGPAPRLASPRYRAAARRRHHQRRPARPRRLMEVRHLRWKCAISVLHDGQTPAAI